MKTKLGMLIAPACIALALGLSIEIVGGTYFAQSAFAQGRSGGNDGNGGDGGSNGGTAAAP